MIDIKIGDSRQLIKKVPDNAFDIVFTSPPFKDEDVDGDYWNFYDEMFHQMIRVASKAVIIIHTATKMNQIQIRYPPKRTLIWGKGIVRYSWRYNPIYIYQISNNYKVNKYIWSDVFGVAPVLGINKCHIYQDPELLYYTILKMFKKVLNVLDPFAGCGVTGGACRKLDLDCTLFELNPDYESLIRKMSMKDTPPLEVYI